MPNLYKNPTALASLTILPGTDVPAGYTQRLLAVDATSGQKTLQTYIPQMNLVSINGYVMHVLSDAQPRNENFNTAPYQSFHVYTTTTSSPDGDLPYKKGDYFVPTGNIVGLVNNTQHAIGGVQQIGPIYELILHRKL